MTDKDLNRAILSELYKIADAVFEKTTIDAGTYTAAELHKRKDSNGNLIGYKIRDVLDSQLQRVTVGGFSCSFLASQVFSIVWQFESLAGVKSSEKKRFVKMDEVKRDALCTFYVDIEKSHLTLCKLVETDPFRPVLHSVFLDVYNECLVATNGHVLKEIPIKIETDCELPKNMYLYLDPKNLKNMIGRNRVDVYGEENSFTTVVTNQSSGQYYKTEYPGKFPCYRNVYTMLRSDGYIRFAKKELKKIATFCKRAKTDSMNAIFSIYVQSGSTSVLFSYDSSETSHKREMSFELEKPAEITIRMGVSGEYLYNLCKDWNGGMWLVDPSRMIILDYDNATLGLMMPKMIEDAISPDECKCTIDPLKRSEVLQPIEPEPIEAAQVDTAQPIEPEPIEAAQVDASRPIEPEPAEAAQVDAAQPIEPGPIEAAQVDAAQPIETAPTYEVWEKSHTEAVSMPWQIRLLLSILRGFGLIKSPLRYAVAQQLEACMEAILPTAVPTETLLQAIRPALCTQFGSPSPTLCGFCRIDAYANGLENLGEIGTFGRCVDPHAAFIERVGMAAVGSRGGAAVPGGRGGMAVAGGRGGVVASMRCGVATAGMRSGASLLPSYALWPLSPITRPTGAGPPPG